MCGIAGIFNRNGKPISQIILRNMTDAIKHRGPDGEGFYTDTFVGLGHRRLAIIDLSPAGHQPMQTADGLITLAYNGEVYNYQELRIALEAAGWRFNSRTDTEVVLAAYAVWGLDCIPKLNGMFAFAVWDRTRQSLILARDRYGIKPLYYAYNQNTFLFASEVKAILAHPDSPRGLDTEGLIEYFTFQNFFSEKTLFQSVQMLAAGTTLTVPLGSGSAPISRRYWDFDFCGSADTTEADASAQLDHFFAQAVNRQLISDVPVGSYLSGGMDSGSIVAIAAKQIPCLKTFTVGFDLHSASGLELSFDERHTAEYLSYLNSTEHYEMVLKAGDMERALQRLSYHLEEPRVGQSYPNFYASQLASKFVKVVLSGAGGDELFAGYPWRYFQPAISINEQNYYDRYFQFWQRLIPADLQRRVFAPIWSDVRHIDTSAIFRGVFPKDAGLPRGPADYLRRSLYFEAKTFLHGLLVVEDKLSMAHGLESRVPFLDNDLVEFAMRLPVHFNLDLPKQSKPQDENSLDKFLLKRCDGKRLLRRAMGRYVPESVSAAHKQGFSAPDASWFKGESIDFVKRTILQPKARIYDFMCRTTISSLVQDHLDGRVNRRLLIWSLLNFESWLATFNPA